MRVKRLLAAILSVAMMFSMMSFSVSAEDSISTWDGATSDAWLADGNPEGTAGDKFYLESAAELAGFAEYVNNYSSTNNLFVGDTVYLCVDVDLNNLKWTPIGTMTTDKRHFYGSFDGQNHTISNLKISEESGQIYGGLFGRFKGTSFSQTFSNLTIHNVDIAAVEAADPSKAGAGALMGYGYDQIIDNVHVTGNISISGVSCIGGLAGQSRANISNSSVEAEGTVSGDYRVGGLVGWFISASANGYNAEINDCSVAGNGAGITVASGNSNAGGLVGRVNDNNGTVAIDDVSVSDITVEVSGEDVGVGAYVVPSFSKVTNATVNNIVTTVNGQPTAANDVAAKIGDKEYLSLYTAISEADGETVELLKNVTIADWQQIEDISFNLVGNNHTITISSVTKNTIDNGGALIRNTTADALNLSDVTFELPEKAVVAYSVGGTMDNVTVTGGRFGFAVNAATNFFGCTFNGQTSEAIYFQDVTGAPGSVVDGCTFNLANARVGALWSDEVFTNNVINYDGNAITGLTILSDSAATVSGNVFSEDTNLEIYVPNDEQGSFTLTGNNIAGDVFVDGAEVADQFANVTIESNTLSDAALEGLQAIKNDVVSVDPVAKVNDKDYYRLADAVAALEEGDILKIATGEYEGFDVLVDNVTITGMEADTVLTITSVPGNAFIGINAEGVSVEDLTFVVAEGYEQTGDYLDGFDAVIGYWSNNFNAGSNVTTGYNVEGCTFINNSTTMGVALFNFSSFEIVGNTFENFNVGIHTMSDGSAMGNVVIKDNTFTKVNEPVNVYWGHTGEDNNSIAITGNDFASAKDADEIKITVHDYASTVEGTSGIDAIDLSGNTYSVATEVVLVDAAVNVAEDVKEELADEENVVVDEKYAAIARVGNDKYFTTLDAAIAGAAGEKITLFANAELNTKLNNATINIDLNGYRMDVNVGANYIIGENSISNGTVDISNASSSQNIFGLAQYQTPATTLTMDKVNFIGDGFNSGYAVFEIGNSGADVALTVTNSTIDLKNDNAAQGGFVKGYGPNCVLTIANTEVTLDNTDMFNVNVAANITDSEFKISNLSDTAFRNLGGTIDNTVISVTNSGNGIRNNSAGYNLAVTNNSSIKISGSTNTEEGKVGDLVLAAGNKVDVDATSELLVETSTIANADDVTGDVISKADAVYVQYKEVDSEEGTAKYEIVLVAVDAEKINELASADLTFNFNGTPVTGGAMSYTVAPVEGVSLTQLGNRFMFNYDGVTKYEETGAAIAIGTITIDGYGSYTLATAVSDKNAVYATEIRDNIVDGFTAAGELIINKDMTANDGMVGEITDGVIAVPTRTLTINLDFPNAVVDNAIAYQDMKVEITGNIEGVNKTVTYNLGEDEVAMVDGSYVVTEDKLVLNNAYTVTVSGAGYRTARYTVTMTEDKTLRFWNNVMDEAQFVEIGKDSSKVNVTFLAGDIVKDNKINIYDLSAVVSYFGTEDCVNSYPEYAKYDLNRDGVIDSKDVAYVLVSWNN